MAKPDPRILELANTLSTAGLDWLANELLAGITRGCVPLEDEAVIEAAQRAALREDQHSYDAPSFEAGEARPFSSEEQLDWAGKYVTTRLTDAVAMTAVSLRRLDELVASEDGLADMDEARTPSAIVLSDGEASEAVTSADLQFAEAALPDLLRALDEWRSDANRSAPA